MRKYAACMTVLFILGAFTGQGQDNPDFTVTSMSMIGKLKYNLGEMMGVPFTAGSYSSVRGTAFFIDSFSTAVIALSNGKMYEYDKLRLNLLTNQVHFLTPKNEELIAADGVIRKIIFFLNNDSAHPVVFSNGYPSGSGYGNFSFFQELNLGNFQALQLTSKSIVNDVGTSSTPMGQHFVDQYNYYLVDQGTRKLVKWKKGKEFLVDFLGAKGATANEYIAKNNLSCRSIGEVVEVLKYCNAK